MSTVDDVPGEDRFLFDSGESEPLSVDLNPLLEAMLEVRGVMAAAVVTADAELLASRSLDRALLERTLEVITGALAAGRALGELLPAADGGTEDSEQVTLMFGEGPILLTPVPGTERVLVLALANEQDLGLARLMLRGALGRLARSVLTGH